MLEIPGFHLNSKLYESANSLVFRASCDRDRQAVILKILKQNYPTPDELTHYRQEYELTHYLNCEGVIHAKQLFPFQNTLVMVLEDFGGEALSAWFAQRTFSLEEALTLAIHITTSLGHVHQQHVIHKDLNPSNIVWNPTTAQLKLIDFGIATRTSRETPTLRNPNILEGTLAYMSPEQTGRMNRSLDYRTDFYSLGVTLYELFTGQLPFVAEDALELVHCHIAKQPIPPSQLPQTRVPVPPGLSNLIMKLLAKTAEDRYQSCRGIQIDLEHCLEQWQTTGAIAEFPLAQHDISSRFQIPQKLYGREQEVAALLAAFERVAHPPQAEATPQPDSTPTEAISPPALRPPLPAAELVLVSGYSGIGKTSLVQEIYKPVTQQRGYFITGKFDQYQRDIPYSAFVAAFASLVQQLLTETKEQLGHWRSRLLAALAPNAQVMIDVIPELELILGAQTPVPTLMPSESRNRFNQVFQNFIQVLAQPEHPLVIFLDDLQWADIASLNLIQVLITSPKGTLFLIGAYRDNEVHASHPLRHLLHDLHQANIEPHTIALAPLQLADINQLLVDTVQRSPQEVTELAQLLLTKTLGNPFFINEFLKTLYLEGLLTFDPEQGGWNWAIADIQQHSITENVVDLMVTKIQRLPITTQTILQRAACIGNQFNLQTVTAILATPDATVATTSAAAIAALQTAVNEGLLFPLKDSYKAVQLGTASPTDTANVEYKFAHDRIQQAAYSLNSPAEQQAIHCQIGQYLLHHTATAPAQPIFDIVNQLNLGKALLATQPERTELAQLNLTAGQKAKTAAAYASAFQYLQTGLALLPPDSWHSHYDLSLALHSATTEAAFLSGHFDLVDRLAETIFKHAKSPIDCVKAYDAKIQTRVAQGNLLDAIQIGLNALEQLGICLPAHPTPEDFQQAIASTRAKLANHSIDALVALPPMTDPHALAAMQLLASMCAAAFLAVPALFPLTVFKLVDLSVEFGNMLLAPFAYAAYGLILCGVVMEFEAGYDFGQLALLLLDRLNAKPIEARTLFPVHNQINVWKLHLSHSLKPHQTCYQVGIEQGDLEFAGYAAMHYCGYAFAVGMPLAELQLELDRYHQAVQQIQHLPGTHFIEICWQTVLNLVQEQPNPCQLNGAVYQEAIALPQLQQANFNGGLFYYHLNKLLLCYLFGDYKAAVAQANQAETYLAAMTGTALIAIFRFYDSLARLAYYPTAIAPEQTTILETVAANQTLLHQWATHAPMNYLHKWLLVEAERYRVLGEFTQASDSYDEAAELAKKHHYHHEKAIIYERATQFYQERGKALIAKTYFYESRYCYLKWGAIAKVKQLERTFPELSDTTKWLQPLPAAGKIRTTTNRQDAATLDITTVMKASQVLSGELNLQSLLTRLMTLILENAGARTGSLFLLQADQLQLVATGTAEPTAIVLHPFTPLASSHELPIALIQYVARKKTHVVLDHATQDPTFANTPYFQTHQPKSILCMPILGQGKLVGILLLENNLSTGVFTADRLTILQMLTSQAAIALENAQLFTTLEDYSQTLEVKNQALEQEISDRRRIEEQLREALTEKEVLLKEIHHRVKNNLQIISGLLQLQAQSLDDAKTINILKESRNRIEAMALIHKKLYFSAEFGRIDMVDYIPSLATSLLMAYQISPMTIALHTEIAALTLNIDLAIPCGLIVNELVSNALKHAFPNGRTGEIQITLNTLPNGHVELIIKDNGIGLPEAVDWEYTQSLGLSLVKDLATEQLEGTLTVDRSMGTSFRITFPQIAG